MTNRKPSKEGSDQTSPRRGSRSMGTGRDELSSTADRLVELAKSEYRFGVTQQNEPFAVARQGANVALMLKGGGEALRAKLAYAYHAAHGRTASAAALSDAITALHGAALQGQPEAVHLRVADHGGSIVVDLGDKRGRALIARPGGWELVDRSPVLFRRTALTAELPEPERGGSLGQLQRLLNVTPEGWSMIVGWMVAALLPNIAHPILLLNGLQGAGKSFVARLLVELVDPSSAPLRSEPHDIEQWHTAAAGSWVVAVDNVSHLPNWFSDALCKAVTGDGVVRRKLFTDGELAVQSFRRAVILTSIDAGSLRDDLGERMLFVDMEGIADRNRRTESEIVAEFVRLKPLLVGALLDGVCGVLTALPDVKLEQLPRMADFAQTLAALDSTGITSGALSQFAGQRQRIATDVIEGDVFATALASFVLDRRVWQGTATELLRIIRPADGGRFPADWPKAANRLRGRINRLIPALRAIGIEVEAGRVKDERVLHLWARSEQSRESIVPIVPIVPESGLCSNDPNDPNDLDGNCRVAPKVAPTEIRAAS
jgi:hypothetical protein